MGDQIVVLGSGIIGLYTTYCLIYEAGFDPAKITIVAEFLPGDQSTLYTSPWAGGNFSCISPADDTTLAYDKFTYLNLFKIQKKLGGPESGLDNKPSTEYWDFYPGDDKINSLKQYLKDFTVIPKSELPEGVEYGITYTTWSFNCPVFLQNMANFLNKRNVTIIRKHLTHISQAYLTVNTKVVFNCTGIGAADLGGVKDEKVYPTRGQVVVVRAPHIQENKMRWGKDYATYIIPRPYSNGELVLGGFLQKDNWTGNTFGFETDDIVARTTALLPKILDEPLHIIRVAAGLRPSRHGGPRIEAEICEEGKLTIHNYGASGYGYQAGYGMSYEAVKLLVDNQKVKSKL
ncbi:D-aspartate oxidase activity protein [[Candida] boidinii]|nr:D-aspartate oxidase activity protein [[Candida] boidinii]